jgi:hypothetical protein
MDKELRSRFVSVRSRKELNSFNLPGIGVLLLECPSAIERLSVEFVELDHTQTRYCASRHGVMRQSIVCFAAAAEKIV